MLTSQSLQRSVERACGANWPKSLSGRTSREELTLGWTKTMMEWHEKGSSVRGNRSAPHQQGGEAKTDDASFDYPPFREKAHLKTSSF